MIESALIGPHIPRTIDDIQEYKGCENYFKSIADKISALDEQNLQTDGGPFISLEGRVAFLAAANKAVEKVKNVTDHARFPQVLSDIKNDPHIKVVLDDLARVALVHSIPYVSGPAGAMLRGSVAFATNGQLQEIIRDGALSQTHKDDITNTWYERMRQMAEVERFNKITVARSADNTKVTFKTDSGEAVITSEVRSGTNFWIVSRITGGGKSEVIQLKQSDPTAQADAYRYAEAIATEGLPIDSVETQRAKIGAIIGQTEIQSGMRIREQERVLADRVAKVKDYIRTLQKQGNREFRSVFDALRKAEDELSAVPRLDEITLSAFTAVMQATPEVGNDKVQTVKNLEKRSEDLGRLITTPPPQQVEIIRQEIEATRARIDELKLELQRPEARTEILARMRTRYPGKDAFLADGLFETATLQARAVDLRKTFPDTAEGDEAYKAFLESLKGTIDDTDARTRPAFSDTERSAILIQIDTIINAIPQRTTTGQNLVVPASNLDWKGPEKQEFGDSSKDRQEAARAIMRKICEHRIPELNFANPAGLDAAIGKVRKMGLFQRMGIYMAVSAAALGTVLALSAFAPALVGSLGLSGFIATKIGAGFAAGLGTRHLMDSIYGMGTNDRSFLGKIFLGRKEISAFEMGQISNGLQKAMNTYGSEAHHYAHETARREKYAREFATDGSVQAKAREPFKIGINELMTSFETGKRREKWRQIGIPLALGIGATAYYHAGDIANWFTQKPNSGAVAGTIPPNGTGPKGPLVSPGGKAPGAIDPLTAPPSGKGPTGAGLEHRESIVVDSQPTRMRITPDGQVCFDYVHGHNVPDGRITWESLTLQGQGYLKNSFYGNIHCKEGTWGALRDVLGRPPHDVLSGLTGQQKQTLIQAFDGILEDHKGAVQAVTGDFTDARHIVKRCGNFAELIGDGRARAHVFEFLKQGPVGQSILNDRGDLINKLFNMARMVKTHT